MIFLLQSNVFKRITERVILPQVKLNHSQSDKVGVKEMEPQDFNELHAFWICLLSMRENGTKISLYHDYKSLDSVLSDISQ